ncbi:MAG: TraB/GumN family protein [Paludibacter sp.]|nr:TraB/GumN family protein [Bacteroidales bacterium]MCM1069029.1 TraB/GumN family protein [Prevotella sp.]MCM1353692.1 TraB/GumN family protein [Bacteroides sp.]MCM1441959.1 TraB/GumN family protein [Muribaculum sp.]MCM1481585.1 TraB/GumN family protein [Paludibacter sp.]
MHHHRLLSMLLIACSCALPAQAQLLYEISGNNTQAKSYLFATDKLCEIAFLDSVPNLFKVFGRCDKVITEMAMYDFEALHALRQAALLPDSVQLKNFYTDEEYHKIDEALKLTLKMGFDKIGRMQPSYLTELYRNELLRRWMNYDENRSSEIFFQSIAEQQGIPIHALDDTGEALYMLFEREPFHWQCKELLKIVEYPEREIRLEKAVLSAYKMGQLTQIAYEISMPDNLSTRSFSDYQVFCRRNLTWVKRLAPYLHEGNAFICLDAVFLGGEKGLLAQLKAAGYKVKAVNRK